MYTDSTGEVKERLKHVEPKLDNARIAVGIYQVFDVIFDAHNLISSHAGRDHTYGIIKHRFSNITQADVVEFIKTCPACQSKNVAIKKLPGAKKPIKSYDLHDQFQIDLIDKRANPQPCIHGILRHWIMTCKDHFSGFAVFEALPRKRPKYVAWEPKFKIPAKF